MSKPIIPWMMYPIEDNKELNMHVCSGTTVIIEPKESKSLRVQHYHIIPPKPNGLELHKELLSVLESRSGRSLEVSLS